MSGVAKEIWLVLFTNIYTEWLFYGILLPFKLGSRYSFASMMPVLTFSLISVDLYNRLMSNLADHDWQWAGKTKAICDVKLGAVLE